MTAVGGSSSADAYHTGTLAEDRTLKVVVTTHSPVLECVPASEFPMHPTAFRKFGQIGSFVFALAGDKRDSEAAQDTGCTSATGGAEPRL